MELVCTLKDTAAKFAKLKSLKIHHDSVQACALEILTNIDSKRWGWARDDGEEIQGLKIKLDGLSKSTEFWRAWSMSYDTVAADFGSRSFAPDKLAREFKAVGEIESLVVSIQNLNARVQRCQKAREAS